MAKFDKSKWNRSTKEFLNALKPYGTKVGLVKFRSMAAHHFGHENVHILLAQDGKEVSNPPVKDMTPLTSWQKACCESYLSGEWSLAKVVSDVPCNCVPGGDYGDGFLHYILGEIAPNNDDCNIAVAIDRLHQMRDDIEQMILRVESLNLCECGESRSTYEMDNKVYCSFCDKQTPEQETGDDHVPELKASDVVKFSERTKLFVCVEPIVDESKLHEYDAEIAGYYAVELEGGLPLEVAASCALDVFHFTQPVKMLEDFEFNVYTIDGALVEECGDRSSAGDYAAYGLTFVCPLNENPFEKGNDDSEPLGKDPEYGKTQLCFAVDGEYPCEGCLDELSDGDRCVHEDNCVAWQKYNEVRPEFDADEAHDYIVSHGFGEPTPEGMKLAKELYAQHEDYAAIGHIVVSRALTAHLEPAKCSECGEEFTNEDNGHDFDAVRENGVCIECSEEPCPQCQEDVVTVTLVSGDNKPVLITYKKNKEGEIEYVSQKAPAGDPQRHYISAAVALNDEVLAELNDYDTWDKMQYHGHEDLVIKLAFDDVLQTETIEMLADSCCPWCHCDIGYGGHDVERVVKTKDGNAYLLGNYQHEEGFVPYDVERFNELKGLPYMDTCKECDHELPKAF